VVVLLAVALLARACSSSADSGSGGSSASSATASASCWDGSSADTVAGCSAPSGLDEIAWMFPSIDDSCDRKGPSTDGLRQVIICTFEVAGGDGYARYSNWDHHQDAIDHYTEDFAAEPGTWTIDGEDVGSMWQSDEPRPDVAYPFKAAAVYRDLPLSVSVYARTREGLQAALDQDVKARPPDELRGVSEGG
jgi:hypothetical protein